METIYTAYTKLVDNKIYYFVKKFMAFPEFPGVAPVLENYGMHTEFSKACGIAAVNDPQIRERLLKEADGTLQTAKVIDIDSKSFAVKTQAI